MQPSDRSVFAASQESSFLISFSSLFLILLTLFVYLQSLTVPSTNRNESVRASVSRFFPKSFDSGNAEKSRDKEIPDARLPVITTTQLSEIVHRVVPSTFRDQVSFEQQSDGMYIYLPSAFLFHSDQSDLAASVVPFFDELSREIVKRNAELALTLPQTGFHHVNRGPLPMSVMRALSLERFMLDRKVSQDKLHIRGALPDRPSQPDPKSIDRIVLVIRPAAETTTSPSETRP